MSNKSKSRMRQYGSLLLCSILCVVFLVTPVRAAEAIAVMKQLTGSVSADCGARPWVMQ